MIIVNKKIKNHSRETETIKKNKVKFLIRKE